MAYKKVGWKDYPSTDTPINATNLDHMDAGILENAQTIGDKTKISGIGDGTVAGAIAANKSAIDANAEAIAQNTQSLTNEQKSMAGYYDVNFHNTYTKKSNRTFIEIATQNDVNLTANTWIKLGLPVPLPKYSVNHKAPCTIINGSTTYAGMVMVSTDGQIKVWSPLTVTSCQIIANFSYDI